LCLKARFSGPALFFGERDSLPGSICGVNDKSAVSLMNDGTSFGEANRCN
jgi:hypothetical protein